eukprot:TRINITY_DN7689_c0_g1_i1.p1 TRINITY_DN7689_c0_g1~~TRINITY_DN7689_c0_g1_i1.p1  ORF type:complete len:116 (+),score=29.40 TRINITY_DN7689_c0_g1_i1:46-348(+)
MSRNVPILDLSPHIGSGVCVKFHGGREVTGILRGWDTLMNMVLDDSVETMRDPEDPYNLSDKKRTLGLSVCRGTAVMAVFPTEGYAMVENPFEAGEGEQV